MKLEIETGGQWSGGGQNLAENLIFARNMLPLSFGKGGRRIIARNVVPLSSLVSGDYVYIPQNAWAWQGPVAGTKEYSRRSLLRLASIFGSARAKRSIRIGPMIPQMKSSASDFLPNVLDIGFDDSLSESDRLSQVSWVPKKKFILVPGSMWRYRNLSSIVVAYSEYRKSGGELDIVFVGPGNEVPSISNLPSSIASGIHIVNSRVSRTEILFAMRRCELCALSSDVEASPVTCLEAGVIGVPVVASDIPAHRYMASASNLRNFEFAKTPIEFAKLFHTKRDFQVSEINDSEKRSERREWWSHKLLELCSEEN